MISEGINNGSILLECVISTIELIMKDYANSTSRCQFNLNILSKVFHICLTLPKTLITNSIVLTSHSRSTRPLPTSPNRCFVV